MSGRLTKSAPRRGVRLWACLVGLVLVPVLTLVAVAAAVGLQRSGAAERAVALERRAGELDVVVRLGFNVVDEATMAQTAVAAAEFSLTPQQAGRLVGLDLEAQWPVVQRRTDGALRELAGTPWAEQARAALGQARRNLDAGRPTEADIARYAFVQQLVEQQARELTGQMVRQSGGEGGAGLVASAAARLTVAYEALTTATDELPQYFGVYLAGDQRHLARQRLAALQQRYDRHVAELGRFGIAELGAEWTTLTTDPGVAAFEQAVDRLLASPPDAPALADGAAVDMFRSGQLRVALLRQLVERAISDVHVRTHDVHEAARASLWRAVAGAVLVGLLTLLGAWLVARSVARPLHVLAQRARRVNAGDLDVAPVAVSGVREVVAVSRVFNEMVRNLRLVAWQTEALARGDLQDVSLAGAVPGALGHSMQGSVAMLSQSIAERDELAQRLRHEATHDGLTGLLNRAAATVSLERALGRARRTGERLAVLSIDLDQFKKVNAVHGHRAADDLLRQCAHRLAGVARDSDTLARLDGDEFVLIADVPDVASAVALAERILEAAREPATVDGVPVQVRVSVGLAVTQDGAESPESLLRDADVAVRLAKGAGGDRVEVADVDLRRQLAEQETMERALTHALEHDLLELHYQPLVDTASGELVGFETLCRWTDPVHGSVPPSAFIQVAEASDLIVELDRWVLAGATRQLAEWRRQRDIDQVHIAVNISGRHLLRADIVAHVEQALAESGLDASCLVVEITETVLLTDLLKAASALAGLRALGVQVAIDDFGTGYTSIAHLRQLPVDILKIDRSLVSRVEHGQDGQLVNLLVQTAHALGLGLVAEGVEQPSQLSHLRAMGCGHAQGYLTGRPVPAAVAETWMAAPASMPTVA